MLIHVPDHFSSKFAFDLAKLPSAKTDRSSLLLAVLFVLGILLRLVQLILLGLVLLILKTDLIHSGV